MLSQETHFAFKNTYRLKVNMWKTTVCNNENQKTGKVSILLSAKMVTRDKDSQCIMIKRLINQNITIINIFTQNWSISIYQETLTDLKGKLTILVGTSYPSFSKR